MMLRPIFVFGLMLAIGQASLFCPHTKTPSDHNSFQTMRIQVKKSVGQEPLYRMANTADTDKSFTPSSSRFRLLTRTDNVECPSKGCITELSAAQPKSQSSVLYLTNIIGKMIPPGFQHVESVNRLYCVIMAGDCGANVPIYRYYKFLPSGLYHAYSTDEDIEIEGYAREPSPLCYGWHTLSSEQLRAEGLEGSGEDYSSEEEEEAVEVTEEERKEARNEVFKMFRETCDDKTPPKPASMKPLNVYVNDKAGALKDHYYTTKVATEEDEKDSENEFYGYTLDKKGSIGMVVVDEDKSKCGCLIRLSQMLDEQTEMIPRKDHKLAADFLEPPPSGGQKYTTLEEEVYCVREQGACGANIALRKYFHILELDTLYTVNTTDVPPLTVPSPPGVLCYIWPNEKAPKKDFRKEESEKKHKTSSSTTTTSEGSEKKSKKAWGLFQPFEKKTTEKSVESTSTTTSKPKTTKSKAEKKETTTFKTSTTVISTTENPTTEASTSVVTTKSTTPESPQTSTIASTTTVSSTTTTEKAKITEPSSTVAATTTTEKPSSEKPKPTKIPKGDVKKKETPKSETSTPPSKSTTEIQTTTQKEEKLSKKE